MKNSRAFFRCALIIAILSFPSILVQSGEMFILQPNSSAQNPPTLESSAIKSADSVDSRYLFLSKKTLDPVDEEQFLKTISRESLKGGKAISSPYFVLQFTGPIQEEWKTALKNGGVIFYDYIPSFAFIVKIPGDAKSLKDAHPFIRAIIPWRPYYKLSFDSLNDVNLSSFIKSAAPKPSKEYILLCFRDVDIDAVRKKIESAGAIINNTTQSEWKIKFRIAASPSMLEGISQIPEVYWIEPAPQWKMFNERARGAGVCDVDTASQTYGLYGAGQIVAVTDSGVDKGSTDPNVHHADFKNGAGGSRIAQIFDLVGDGGNDKHGHGTHVAGSVCGNGLKSGSNPAAHNYPAACHSGSAPEATLVFQAVGNNSTLGLSGIPDDLNILFKQTRDAGARVHNNSWGGAAKGSYLGNCQDVDEFCWNNKDYTILYAAGNEGVDMIPVLGMIDDFSLGAPASSKNCITVGASENNRPDSGVTSNYGAGGDPRWANEPIKSDTKSNNVNGMAAFSSRGPCWDGRYKPDICAPGTNILSTRSTEAPDSSFWAAFNADYAFMGGTSMASPLTCGMCALLREYLVRYRGIASPSSALVKALLLNGAVDMAPGQYGATGDTKEQPTAAPNDIQGWGRASVQKSLPGGTRNILLVDNPTGIAANGEIKYKFEVKNNDIPLRAKLVWTDFPGSPAADGGLVNDLNLSIIQPDNNVLTPLNPRRPGIVQHLINTPSDSTTPPVIPNLGMVHEGMGVRFVPAQTPMILKMVNFALVAAYPGEYYVDLFILADNQGMPGDIIWKVTYVKTVIQAQDPTTKAYFGICSVPFNILSFNGPFHVALQWSYDINTRLIGGTKPPIKTGNDFHYYFDLDYYNFVWHPWASDAAADLGIEVIGTGPTQTTGNDSVNNVEGIELAAPQTGLYTISVKGNNIAQGPQPFAVVISGNVAPETTPTPTPIPITLVQYKDYLTGKISFTEQQKASADLNKDKKIDIADLIKRILAPLK